VKAPKPAVAAGQDPSKLSPAERGKLQYQNKACVSCHSLDGTQVIGPTFKGLYGRSGTFDDGTAYTADDAYIKESILQPNAHVVNGFPKPSPMPPYEGQFSDADIADMIEFLKTVK
jgi:cytochrome c oxidase subunit II